MSRLQNLAPPLKTIAVIAAWAIVHLPSVAGQGLGGSATIKVSVVDPSGGAPAAAPIEIQNRVSGYRRAGSADQAGALQCTNVPFNSYHLTISASGFQTFERDVAARTSVPISLAIKLNLASSFSSISVESGPAMIESTPTAHAAVDSSLIQQLPIQNQSTGF